MGSCKNLICCHIPITLTRADSESVGPPVRILTWQVYVPSWTKSMEMRDSVLFQRSLNEYGIPDCSIGLSSFSQIRLRRWRGRAFAMHCSSVTDLCRVIVTFWGGTMISGDTSKFWLVSTSNPIYSEFSSWPNWVLVARALQIIIGIRKSLKIRKQNLIAKSRLSED